MGATKDPEAEIEITAAMLAAGIEGYRLFDSRDNDEWVVTEVYTAMEVARLKEVADRSDKRDHLPAVHVLPE